MTNYLMHQCVGHTTEGRKGRSQAGPKGRQLEVGVQQAPRLLVYDKTKYKMFRY